jgi:SPP1 family predicted phage head-tail adaptor
MKNPPLRHRLLLERPTGGPLEWVTVAQVWASIEPISGTESVSADRLAPRTLHQLRMRYRRGVTPDMRFRLGTRNFHIVSVINEGERARYLVCRVEERAA